MSTILDHTFDTSHDDVVHDVQLDYYGKRIATCSSDRTIKIFDLVDDNHDQKHIADLKGHEGPVWRVSWAHPQFGSILASCSYDHKVIIWKETKTNVWQKVYEYRHDSSVNAIAWAPHELGLILATASSDCTLTIITHKEQNDTFSYHTIKDAHENGCNSVSWAPATSMANVEDISRASKSSVKMIASGGGDKLIKIWRCSEDGQWGREPISKLSGHTDWVRDVQWAPNIGLPYDTISSCSHCHVIMYTKDQETDWKSEILTFNTVVWSISWSVTGNILAISTADNQVTLYKNDSDKGWSKLSSLEDDAR